MLQPKRNNIDTILKNANNKEKKKQLLDESNVFKANYTPTSIKYKKQREELNSKATTVKSDIATNKDKEQNKNIYNKKEWDKNKWGYAEDAASVAEVGNFIPHSIAQAIGKAGAIASAGLSARKAKISYDNKDYKNMGLNLGMMAISAGLSSKTFNVSTPKASKLDAFEKAIAPKTFISNISNGIELGRNITKVPSYINVLKQKPGQSAVTLLRNKAALGSVGVDLNTDFSKESYDNNNNNNNNINKTINMKKMGGTIKPVKKAFAGALIGAGLGVVNSVIANNKARKEARAASTLAATNNFQGALQEQDIYADQFQNDNINDLPVYAKGGDIKTNSSSSTGKYDAVGGDLLPISEDAQVVNGNTHEENVIDDSYGVTLSEDGEPVANVEDKEVVVDDTLVFSDTLKKGGRSFASIAMDVNTKIGELQAKNKSAVKPAEVFSNERTIKGLENMNQELFKEQELVKANTVGTEDETVDVQDGKVPVGKNGMNINKPNFLGGFGGSEEDVDEREDSTFEDLAPMLVDNVANMFLTSGAPKPVAPTLRRTPIMDTRVNANPQLASVAGAVNASNETIRANTNNSSVARANITSTNLRGAEANNSVYANKQAGERQLRNQQQAASIATANANADLQEDYQNDVRDSRLQKNSAYSKNLQNAMEDVTAVKQNNLQKDSDDMLITLGLLDDPTGEKGRTYSRLGRNMNAKSKAIYLKELERMKQFNANKNQ